MWLLGAPGTPKSQAAPHKKLSGTHSGLHDNTDTQRIPEQPCGSWSPKKYSFRARPQLASLASFSAQHKRSCCDYKRLLWAPSQEHQATAPTIHSQRARAQPPRWPSPVPLSAWPLAAGHKAEHPSNPGRPSPFPLGPVSSQKPALSTLSLPLERRAYC